MHENCQRSFDSTPALNLVYYYAFEATTGKELWRFQTGAPVWGSAAVTYMLDGREWVLTTAGLTFKAFALPVVPR